jgi:predicted outer membrane protein
MKIDRETQRPGRHWRLRRMLYVSAMAVVSALVAIGPADTAGAQSSVPSTNVEASTAPPAGDVSLLAEEVTLTEADRDFVTKVRLAGLWEIPASKMAVKKGVAPRVRQIGRMISAQHVKLDLLARTAAAQLGMELPNEPNADQQGWLKEMANATGTDFDDVYTERLRAAHGKIFPVIGLIRASTKNDTVRKLAQDANGFVLTHLTLLESTGLVRYEELPTAAQAAAAAAKAPAAATQAPGVAVPPIASAATSTAGTPCLALVSTIRSISSAASFWRSRLASSLTGDFESAASAKSLRGSAISAGRTKRRTPKW